MGEWIGHQFEGIEQPNEAYAPVLKMNIAYEQTNKPRRQRIDDSRAPATTEYEPVHDRVRGCVAPCREKAQKQVMHNYYVNTTEVYVP